MSDSGLFAGLKRLFGGRAKAAPRDVGGRTGSAPAAPAAPAEIEPAFGTGSMADLLGPFMQQEEGVWSALLPGRFTEVPANSLMWNNRSPVVLLENGAPLSGGRHAEFPDIRRVDGSYNHWGSMVYFSASDGRDPNLNGRRYAVRLDPAPPRVAGFGSCHAGLLMKAAARRGWANPVSHQGLTYGTEDTRQLMRQLRGEQALPDRLGAYLASAPGLAGGGALDGLSGLLLEISSRTVIDYEGWALNRVAISDLIVNPAARIGPDLGAAAARWFDFGIYRHQEETRATTAAVLLASLPQETEADMLRRAIVSEARGVEQTPEQVADGVEAILSTIGAPSVMMLHTLRYMPDGRPLRWPAGFHPLLKEIAANLGVPVLDPAAMVEARGPDQTLAEDLEHYSRAFIDDLAGDAFRLLGIRTQDRPAEAPASDLLGED